MCTCQSVSCSWGAWGNWSGKCGTVNRTRHIMENQTTVQAENCDAVPKKCMQQPETENNKLPDCKCVRECLGEIPLCVLYLLNWLFPLFNFKGALSRRFCCIWSKRLKYLTKNLFPNMELLLDHWGENTKRFLRGRTNYIIIFSDFRQYTGRT